MNRIASTIAALTLAGCYAPSPELGAPCSPSFECPSGQICDRNAAGGPRCANEVGNEPLPPGVTDVSAGGSFPFDVRDRADEHVAPCAPAAGPAGPDIRFQLSLPAAEIVYLDTFGSSGNPALAIYSGGCAELGASEACADDSCNGQQAQGAWRLAAGTHCIVVDHAGIPDGAGTLRVVRGRRDGDALPARTGTVTGDTCKDDNSNDAGCGDEPAQDHHYYFTLCSGETAMARLETCGGATWDTVLQFRDGDDNGRACDDDDDANRSTVPCGGTDNDQSLLTTSLVGPGLFWAIIDGFGECGTYTMKYQY